MLTQPKLIKVIDYVSAAYVHDTNVHVWLTRYVDDSSWAILLTTETQEPLMTVTVNLSPSYTLSEPNHVFVKTWSENAGILEEMIENEILQTPVRCFKKGFVDVYECPLAFDPESL